MTPSPLEPPSGGSLRVAHASEPSSDQGLDAGEKLSRLGPFLCWAVVFADIGTSVYYTPGILFQTPGIGYHAALYVAMTTVVFILLTVKYGEVTVRYPEGGGVVTVGARALHPFVGLVGGMFILVDYFLTAALSADSGIIYLSDVVKSLTPLIVPITVVALVVLGLLNWIGIKESARVSAILASLAFLSQMAVVVATVIHVGVPHLVALLPRVLSGQRLTPLHVLTGYAGAFLAFSGLESISQLSPAMAQPRKRIARLALGLVIITMGLTSPLLTLWSTTVLPISGGTDPNQVISLLGGFVSGRALEVEVAISGALLLVFASNTAIIGSYHVFLALSRMRFFPRFIEQRNSLRDTPHWAILLAVGIPIVILVAASGSTSLLGDLYAFGLLGAFSLTCLSLDIVRWRERRLGATWARTMGTTMDGPAWQHRREIKELGWTHWSPRTYVLFAVGVLTTVLVVVAWCTNLVNKPAATFFGGGVTVIGLAVALVNYTVQSRRGVPVAFPSVIRTALNDAIMVVLPTTGNHVAELARAAGVAANGRPVVFLYHGPEDIIRVNPGLFQVTDPYLYDRPAQEAFGRAEKVARKLKLDRHYVYVPGNKPDGVTRVWQTIRPRDTLVQAGREGELHDLAPDRIRRTAGTAVPVLHYLKQW